MKNKLKEMKNSVAKIIAMLLVIMVCAAQVNIPVFADVTVVVQSDGTTQICTPVGTGSTTNVLICN